MNDNQIILITYPDSLGQNIRELRELLNRHFAKALGGVHLLPFFPSSGDRGFAPLCYDRVDAAFGTWDDIEALAKDYALTVDFMINHISAESAYYRDFLKKKDESPYAGYFLRCKDFWRPGEPTQEQVERIYKRKPRAPFITSRFADGSEEEVWCTFSEQQIDFDCFSPSCRTFIADNLIALTKRGAKTIRLDAFAYAAKKRDTSCFFIEPEVWDLLDFCRDTLKPYGANVLPEIHEHYTLQLKLSDHGYAAYDFALPMLLLHALYYGGAQYLKHWLELCPRKQYTTLDTHDGIGVVDVRGLLPDDEIERTEHDIFRYGANVKRIYNSAEYNNLDVYQINCTYYSALGDDDHKYLIARAVQFFAPGTPMVYYVGLLAGWNDIDLLEQTKEGRNINRHYYTADEVAKELRRPVTKKLLELMEFRNTHPAFDGEFSLLPAEAHQLNLRWENGEEFAELYTDFQDASATIRYSERGIVATLEL